MRETQLLLRRLRSSVPIVKTVSIVDPDGALRFGDPVPPGVDIGTQTYGGYIGDAVYGDAGAPVVYAVVQARGRTGELMGVVIAALDLGFVRDVIASARLGPGARVLVVDGAGVLVATSDTRPVSTRSLAGHDPVVDRALGSSVEGTMSAQGMVSSYRNLSSYQTLRGVRWAIPNPRRMHSRSERRATRRSSSSLHWSSRSRLARGSQRGSPARSRISRVAPMRSPPGTRPMTRRSWAPVRSACSPTPSTRWRSVSPSVQSSLRRSRAVTGWHRSA